MLLHKPSRLGDVVSWNRLNDGRMDLWLSLLWPFNGGKFRVRTCRDSRDTVCYGAGPPLNWSHLIANNYKRRKTNLTYDNYRDESHRYYFENWNGLMIPDKSDWTSDC
jgi:hypothetical protein